MVPVLSVTMPSVTIFTGVVFSWPLSPHVHTNGLENFWSLLKRSLGGTCVAVEPFHLFRYLDEQAFRYNERKHSDGDSGRFADILENVAGRRLTYKELTGGECAPTAATA
jgi:hypothetical protein